MNTVTQLLQTHRSDRSFTQQPISDEILSDIIECAHLAPTSVNSQQVSLIVSRDPARKARIAELAGGQPWIAQAAVFITLVLDLHKTEVAINKAGQTQRNHLSVEAIVSGCTDVGIALEALATAARSYGLGIVPIGGIRKNPEAMIELLELPEHTFPVAGIAIGHIDQPAHQKPRLPIASFRHDEAYQEAALIPAIDTYNQQLMQHWQQINRTDGLPWGENTAGYYQHIYYPNVLPALLKQGFKVDK